ncbi:hypothetical protein HPP92_029057, partial [Vanilla planifolia]
MTEFAADAERQNVPHQAGVSWYVSIRLCCCSASTALSNDFVSSVFLASLSRRPAALLSLRHRSRVASVRCRCNPAAVTDA